MLKARHYRTVKLLSSVLIIRHIETFLGGLDDSSNARTEHGHAKALHLGKNLVGTGKFIDRPATPKERDSCDSEE